MNLIPFKDYYMNCYLNNLMTLLIHNDESYRLFSYENNYYYFLKEVTHSNETCGKINTFLSIEYVMEPYLEIYNYLFEKDIIAIESMDFPPLGTTEYLVNNVKQFLSEAEKLIKEDYILFIGADLFYLIPNSPVYHKIHRYHYTMMYEYNENLFMIMDEGPSGYDIQSVRKEQFEAAINNSKLIPKCFIYKNNTKDNKIPHYTFNIERIIKNAKRICNEIACISSEALNIKSYEDIHIESLHRIMNRQYGNMLLFKSLSENNLLENSKAVLLYSKTFELYNRWLLFKNAIIKANMIKKMPDINLIEYILQQLKEEHTIWKNFLEY